MNYVFSKFFGSSLKFVVWKRVNFGAWSNSIIHTESVSFTNTPGKHK